MRAFVGAMAVLVNLIPYSSDSSPVSGGSCFQLQCRAHNTVPIMGFRFAAAVSQHSNLYQAIAEVVTSCRDGLGGRLPDFCQLLLTKEHARVVAHAPKCLLDKLISIGGVCSETLPVVMGGVVQAVSGQKVSPGHGVSLLAASLPGVELMPFHVDTPALPQLSAAQWSRLLTSVSHRHPRPRSSWSSTHIHVDSDSDSEAEVVGGNATATLMLSSPHFTEVERLLQRFSNVLPGMPLLGGVTESDAWLETEHDYGALFLGGRVFCQGAVGCVMHGCLAVQHLLVPGYVPVGHRTMTVTQADGNCILSLDGKPAQDSVVSLLSGMPDTQQGPPLALGINEVGLSGSPGSSRGYDPRLFVARSMGLMPTHTGRPVIAAATHEVPLGSRVLLLRPDYDSAKQRERGELQRLLDSLPPSALKQPEQFGLLGYSCVQLEGDASKMVGEIWPQVPFAGGNVQGEFAGPEATWSPTDSPETPAAPAKLHAFSATMGLICHQDALQQ